MVIVGERKDSQTYVRMKKKACEEVGIASFGADLPEDITQEELLKVVEKFNNDPDVHGILVQLPVSAQDPTAAMTSGHSAIHERGIVCSMAPNMCRPAECDAAFTLTAVCIQSVILWR